MCFGLKLLKVNGSLERLDLVSFPQSQVGMMKSVESWSNQWRMEIKTMGKGEEIQLGSECQVPSLAHLLVGKVWVKTKGWELQLEMSRGWEMVKSLQEQCLRRHLKQVVWRQKVLILQLKKCQMLFKGLWKGRWSRSCRRTTGNCKENFKISRCKGIWKTTVGWSRRGLMLAQDLNHLHQKKKTNHSGSRRMERKYPRVHHRTLMKEFRVGHWDPMSRVQWIVCGSS